MTLHEAEQAIAAVLRQLEVDCDCLVDSIVISDIDVTQMEDDRTKLLRTVAVVTHRLPGRRWCPS